MASGFCYIIGSLIFPALACSVAVYGVSYLVIHQAPPKRPYRFSSSTILAYQTVTFRRIRNYYFNEGSQATYYMLAMASTGSILEAFQAGYRPATKFTRIAPTMTYSKNSGFIDTVNLDTRYISEGSSIL